MKQKHSNHAEAPRIVTVEEWRDRQRYWVERQEELAEIQRRNHMGSWLFEYKNLRYDHLINGVCLFLILSLDAASLATVSYVLLADAVDYIDQFYLNMVFVCAPVLSLTTILSGRSYFMQ